MRISIRVVAGFITALSTACAFAATSFDGEWNGDLRCDAAMRSSAPAFSAPVTMTVAGETVKLGRNTDAVAESLAGRLSQNGRVSLSGSGRRTSGEASWTIEIDGTFSGTVFRGNGARFNERGYKVRDCFVELERTVVAAAISPQRLEAKPSVPSMKRPVLASPAPTVEPTVPKVASPASSQTISPSAPSTVARQRVDTTLTGVMKWGGSDSCLEVQNASKAICYGFVTRGTVANALHAACGQPGKCAVTGTFDNEKQEIVSVTSAVALAETPAPSVEQTPAAVNPVANTPTEPARADTVPASQPMPIPPTATAPVATPMPPPTPAHDFTAVKWGIGIAAILALLGGVVFVARKRRRGNGTVMQQIAEVKSEPPVQSVPLQTEIAMPPPPQRPSAPPPPATPVARDVTYQIVLRGIQPNKSPGEVRAKLAALFKATPDQVDTMVASNGYLLKKGATLAVANNYRTAIEVAGAVCGLIEEDEALDFDIGIDDSAPPESFEAEQRDSARPAIAPPPILDARDIGANPHALQEDSQPNASNQGIPESWKRKFALIEQAGGPKLKKLRDLPTPDRLAVVFNALGALFGPFYYLVKGMWKKAIVLLAISAIGVAILELSLRAVGVADSIVTAFIAPAVFGTRANLDFYKQMVLGDSGWW